MCISVCADEMTLQNARCNSKDKYMPTVLNYKVQSNLQHQQHWNSKRIL